MQAKTLDLGGAWGPARNQLDWHDSGLSLALRQRCHFSEKNVCISTPKDYHRLATFFWAKDKDSAEGTDPVLLSPAKQVRGFSLGRHVFACRFLIVDLSKGASDATSAAAETLAGLHAH
jgi:hypothetical protein